jgi:CO/xanthine dehydrogenase FAD-binding subunit
MSKLLTVCVGYRNIGLNTHLYTNNLEGPMSAPYYRPKDLRTALDLLASHELTVAAGCTDLYPTTERKTLQNATLDITGIPGLRGITATSAGGLRIGATTTWAEVIRAPLPAAFDGLKQAACSVGARQIQNQATVAGNLCNASPAADGVPPLLTLDAVIELKSKSGIREVALTDFITGPRKTNLQPGELVSAILFPSQALVGTSGFRKLGARDYLVISIAMTAARIEMSNGIVTSAALAIGSCGPVAVRLPKIEAAMIGHPLDVSAITDELVAQTIAPIDDMRADAQYRRISAAELMRRTVMALLDQSKVAA